jgi:hypothetical protein
MAYLMLINKSMEFSQSLSGALKDRVAGGIAAFRLPGVGGLDFRTEVFYL